jgi:ABC-type lipoprotein release transport system permease subunit
MGTQILVKSGPPPLTLLRAVRMHLTAVDPEQQSYSATEELDTWITDQPEWQQEHLAAWIFGVFGGLGLALAAVGLYSVVTYTVAQRTNEFGLRMALGARSGHVLRIVFASIFGSVAVGIGAGLGLTRSLSTIVAQWVKGSSADVVILLAGALLLSFVSAVACVIPAWRALRIDPMAALRCE